MRENTIIPHEFGLTRKDLEYLMQTSHHDGGKEFNEIYVGLEEKLQTNFLTGLTGDETDLHSRKKIFGRNEIPKKSSKSFFRLIFEAIQDLTLIILIICSLISFVLAFYQTESPTFEYQLKQHRKKISLPLISCSSLI